MSLEVAGGVVHRLVDGRPFQHRAQGVDRPVMDDDFAVRISFPDLLELAAGQLSGLICAFIVRLRPPP